MSFEASDSLRELKQEVQELERELKALRRRRKEIKKELKALDAQDEEAVAAFKYVLGMLVGFVAGPVAVGLLASRLGPSLFWAVPLAASVLFGVYCTVKRLRHPLAASRGRRRTLEAALDDVKERLKSTYREKCRRDGTYQATYRREKKAWRRQQAQQRKERLAEKIRIALKALPIVSPGQVPKCTHPNRPADWEGSDRTSPHVLVSSMIDKHPRIHDDHIAWSEQKPGIYTRLLLYRIAQDTWRLVRRSSYTD